MKTRSVNFLILHAKCVKTNPLTKLRFKPQVSAAFASVSILIYADSIHPDPTYGRHERSCGVLGPADLRGSGRSQILQCIVKTLSDSKGLAVE
jgi:hypothetical protein